MLRYQIALSLIPNVGDVIAKKLIAYCGSAEAIFKEKKSNLLKIPGIGGFLASSIVGCNVLDRADEELEFIKKNKIETFFYLDKNYPLRLKQCDDGPILIYFKGNADLNDKKIISIVGTRKATEYGKKICQDLIEGLSSNKVTIVSGLAIGIDICAHKSAYDAGLTTIGVVAHGLDRIYPSIHKNLAEKMQDNGGILSDFVSKSIPDRENFPKRNRIIAGIADAVIVVEAGVTGGALITAEIANSYNREVFAIPGRVNDIFSEGCNNLIKTNKAALIHSAQDIAVNLNWDIENMVNKATQKRLFYEPTKEEQLIVDLIKKEGECSIDFICIQTKLNISKVSFILLNLEFNGIITQLPGKIYKPN